MCPHVIQIAVAGQLLLVPRNRVPILLALTPEHLRALALRHQTQVVPGPRPRPRRPTAPQAPPPLPGRLARFAYRPLQLPPVYLPQGAAQLDEPPPVRYPSPFVRLFLKD